jgi:hypothetical protein
MTRHKMKRAIYLVLILVLSAHASYSQDNPPSPKQIFYDDKILDSAASEILRMNYDGTKSLTDVLALCEGDLTENEIIQRDCRSAKTRFDIEFGSGGALDDVLSAEGIVAMLLRSEDKAHTHDPDGAKMIDRRIAIDAKLSRVANARFEELRTQQLSKH